MGWALITADMAQLQAALLPQGEAHLACTGAAWLLSAQREAFLKEALLTTCLPRCPQ